MDGRLVPLDYRVEDGALHIVNNHAESVRSLFQLYFSVGSIMRLRNISSLRVFGFSFVSMARANRWIAGQDIWEQVEDRLRSHLDHTRTKRMRQTSDTPLVGKFFDDRGQPDESILGQEGIEVRCRVGRDIWVGSPFIGPYSRCDAPRPSREAKRPSSIAAAAQGELA